MKKILFLFVAAFALTAGGAMAKKPACDEIKDGVIEYSAGHYLGGQPLQLGYDIYGYNYQAHLFKGSYANVYLGRVGLPPYEGDTDVYLAENPSAETHWAWPYRDINLSMKWNDAWISNTDCSDDGALDRHYGHLTYVGSGAWETNHMWGEGWNYFTKIVAVSEDAERVGAPNTGMWYAEDGSVIGPDIWGQFATIMEVSNDPSLDEHGLLYKGARPGFGNW